MNLGALQGAVMVLLAIPASPQTMNTQSDTLTAHNGTVSTDGVGIQTVNDYSPDQAAEARHDVMEAGYRPSDIQMAQAGNIFFTATRNGQIYTVLVTPDEKVYASMPVPETTGMASNEQR